MERLMRKKAAFPLVAVVAVALAACSTAPAASPSAAVSSSAAASSAAASASAAPSTATSSAPSAAASTELTMSGWSDDKTMDALIAQFQTDNPGVTVKHVGLPWPDILTQINTELVSGTASDIVVVFPGNGNPITVQTLAKGNYLADLSSASWASKFSAGTKSVMAAGDQVLMASDNSGIIPAIYNKAALDAVGATPPTTWSQVLALCGTAKAKGKVAYALGGANGGNLSHYLYALTATLVYGPDSTFAKDQAAGNATFVGSKWEAAITQLLQMRDAGCFSKNPLGTTIDIAQKQVATGDALGIVTVSQQISAIQKMAPDAALETAPLPATDNAADTVLPVGLGAGYGVNASSKNADIAKKFMDFYMSDAGLNIAVTAGSNFPSIPLTGYTPSATLVGVATQAQSGKTAPYPDQLWPNSVVNQTYQDQMQLVFGDKASIPDALKAMDVAYKG
jgi:raffinose/stachyose/melibiose transport system substrate-binding protein